MKTRLAASTAVLTSLVLLTGKAPTLIAFVTTTVTTQASRILPPKRMEIAPMPAQAAPDQTESLAGQVVEDSSANPIASAEVRFHRAGLNELAADLETDRQGRFTAPSLPSGEYSVEVVKPNYASTSFHLAVPSARFTVRLVRYGVIDGQAGNAAGQPLAGVIRASGGRTVGSGRITILSKDPATGRLSSFREEALEDSGHYRVFDLPPGQYSVAVWYSGQNEGSGLQLYPDNASPRVFTVTGGEEYDGINFTIAARPTVRISGRIQLPEGVKSQFQLALGLPDQPMLPIAQTLSENDGTFRFDGIPAGSYDLFVGGPITGYGPFFSILGKGDSFFSRARVQSAGQDIEGLSISLSPGKSLHVMVRGKDAGPLPAGCPAGGDISLTPLEPWAIQFASQSAVSFGKEQVISNLAPGLYRARASQLGDRCFQTTDAVADLRGDSPEPVALELAAAGSVHGLLRGDTSGKVVVLMDVRATDGAQARVAYPDAGGRFRFETLPPARYRIAAYPADRNPRSRWVSSEPSGKQQGREIEVGGGVPTEVEISQ